MARLVVADTALQFRSLALWLFRLEHRMTGILNLPGLNELGMKELAAEYHVKAKPAANQRSGN